MSEFLKGIIFYFINHILNRFPSRRVRMFFYSRLSAGKISQKASIGLGVKVLDIRNIKIGDFTNINFDSILDGRGDGIEIGSNVDIAPQVNIWSLEHDPNDSTHASRSGKVIIEDNCWLANRVTVLPNTYIEKGCVVGASSLVKGKYGLDEIVLGYKAQAKKKINAYEKREQIKKLRVFR